MVVESSLDIFLPALYMIDWSSHLWILSTMEANSEGMGDTPSLPFSNVLGPSTFTEISINWGSDGDRFSPPHPNREGIIIGLSSNRISFGDNRFPKKGKKIEQIFKMPSLESLKV